MTGENIQLSPAPTNLVALRDKLPYQYAAIISKRLTNRTDIKEEITAAQIRQVLNEQTQNPEIIIPVLEEAWKLYDDQKRIETLKQKQL